MNDNYVCYQLWGDDRTYVVGMLENVRLCKTYYPGCKVVVYKARGCVVELPGCLVIDMDDNGWYNYFWRLHALDDLSYDLIHFRDADSRPNSKERAAVQHWLAGGRTAYVMHDHDQHGDAIMAGMWGVKGGVVGGVKAKIAAWAADKTLKYGSDQHFLHNLILPEIRGSLMRYGTRHRWPQAGIDRGAHVGEKIVVP